MFTRVVFLAGLKQYSPYGFMKGRLDGWPPMMLGDFRLVVHRL